MLKELFTLSLLFELFAYYKTVKFVKNYRSTSSCIIAGVKKMLLKV